MQGLRGSGIDTSGGLPAVSGLRGLGEVSPPLGYGLTIAGAALFGAALGMFLGGNGKKALAGAALQGGATSALVAVWGKSLDSTALRAAFGVAGVAALYGGYRVGK
jgi:hypothetical protein